MPSQPTPAEILNRFYQAEAAYFAATPSERDFAGGMGRHLSPDLKLLQSPDLPYSQSLYSGHEGFQAWSGEIAELFDSLAVENPKVFEKEGEDAVVVVANVNVKTREGQREKVVPMVQVVKVDRAKEWITEIQPFYWDVGGLREVLGK